MDMPISHINTRLFSRLPSDLGMGLLFATGKVSQVVLASGGRPIQFTLRDSGYALCCKIAPSVEPDFILTEGQRVRATGHMSFSSQSARYHLVIREVELLKDAELKPPSADLRPPNEILTATYPPDGRQSVLTAPVQLALAEIPDWVYALAPPEIRSTGPTWGTERAEVAIQERWDESTTNDYRSASLKKLKENEQLMTFLLEALDRSEHEDVELTAEVMARYQGVMPGETPPPVAQLPRYHTTTHTNQGTISYSSIGSSGVWLLITVLFLILGVMLIIFFLLYQTGLV